MGWHWGVKGWGIIWIYVQLPWRFHETFRWSFTLLLRCCFLRNHHYEQHSELRKSAGQLRDEEVEAIAPICLDGRPQPMEIGRCCLQLTSFCCWQDPFVVQPWPVFLVVCYPPVFSCQTYVVTIHHNPETPPEASLQNFLKTNKELVWKLKGGNKRTWFFWSSGAFVGPFMLAVYNCVRAKCVKQCYSTQWSSRDNRGKNWLL